MLPYGGKTESLIELADSYGADLAIKAILQAEKLNAIDTACEYFGK
ncbi:hypothetical protein Fsol_00357 [Candidatus Fokinia solitaria]|uniref:Uncharacterized protein n=1 Tax=Candidatus Fokinia solitaria TaxID=1802984 RepID=A0A2U8BS69_9RICK|nr:hypothetical protein [Candidatus Fokinia solitaria]AWD33155.1 hypothetical protein Fsol_00357 [Candidatus Fokinia solitaria]